MYFHIAGITLALRFVRTYLYYKTRIFGRNLHIFK